MVKKSVSDLNGGEKLAKPIMTWDYQIILPEGTYIKKDYIERLTDLGIFDVYIEEEEPIGEISILQEEIRESITAKVRKILERHTYNSNDEKLMELCETADEIIDNILEEEQIVEKIFDIKERSADIYEHSINICSLAILTALKMELDYKLIHDIGVGCLLHDIGLRYEEKDFANCNVSSLSGKDQIEYKKHPVYGYSSLVEQTWLSTRAKNIILYHHERLDGSGFPLHMKEISVECRIVSVCDTFDELICGIACEKMKVYEAIEYLKCFKGIYFDPKVVDVFLDFTAVYPAGTMVVTSEGEVAVVVSQNKGYQDRPVIRIIKDKNGNLVTEEVIKDMEKILNIFIDKVLE